MLTLLLFCPLVYVLASINFSILFIRIMRKGDPRAHYSSNAGVTNVYRMTGMTGAAVVLILDLSRAAGVAWAGLYIMSPQLAVWLVVPLFVGVRYPCFHGFRGGKGVAGFLGFTAAFEPLWAVASASTWVLTYALIKKSFIGSFAMILILATGLAWSVSGELPACMAGYITAALIIIAHRSNLTGLMRKHSTGEKP
jgi:acyl phosphate:glycerol-3-phosphate acyltransferase